MPTIKITKPFNFRAGGVVDAYEPGEQDVPQAVADHAVAKGFADKPAEKPAAASTSKTAAKPAAAADTQ